MKALPGTFTSQSSEYDKVVAQRREYLELFTWVSVQYVFQGKRVKVKKLRQDIYFNCVTYSEISARKLTCPIERKSSHEGLATSNHQLFRDAFPFFDLREAKVAGVLCADEVAPGKVFFPFPLFLPRPAGAPDVANCSCAFLDFADLFKAVSNRERINGNELVWIVRRPSACSLDFEIGDVCPGVGSEGKRSENPRGTNLSSSKAFFRAMKARSCAAF